MKRIFIISFIFSIIFNIIVFANVGANVSLRVEGLTDTILKGNIKAETFAKAIQALGNEVNIEVIMKNNSSKQELFSINGFRNNTYNLNDKWQCYIIRNKKIIDTDNILDINLIDGDELIVYYGDINTKKITDIKEVYLDDKLTIELTSSVTIWVEEDKIWEPKTIDYKLNNVNVHMTIGNGEEIIKTTDLEGKVTFDIKSPNIYSYYIDGYNENDMPIVVKTFVNKKALGINENSYLTRAELVAFLVNYFKLIGNEFHIKFLDVYQNTQYRSEINIASSLGIINGNGQNEFKPNDKITMQEVAVLLYKIFKDKPIVSNVNLDNINSSEWAKLYIKGVIERNLLNNIDNWVSFITLKELRMFI